MTYNFDEIIDRKNTNSLSVDGWKNYMFPDAQELNMSYADEDIIRLWVADMDFSTPGKVLDAIKARVDQRIIGYSRIFDPQYFTVLKNWFQRQYQTNINIDELVFSPGIVVGLTRLVGLLTKADENILITTPSYAPFKRAGDLNDRTVYTTTLQQEAGHYQMNLDDIAHQLDDPSKNIKVFILCNPHNPTGRIWTKAELKAIGQLCIERNIWIIADEIHCDLLRTGNTYTPFAPLFPDYERIITCTAPSKTFNMAGALLSHIFIRSTAIKQEWDRLFHCSLSPLSIVAAQTAYSECDDWLVELKAYLDGNFALMKDYIETHWPKAQFTIPEATYLGWVDMNAYVQELNLTESMSRYLAENAGVLVEDGGLFVKDGDGCIRVNVACPRQRLAEALKRISAALNLAG